MHALPKHPRPSRVPGRLRRSDRAFAKSVRASTLGTLTCNGLNVAVLSSRLLPDVAHYIESCALSPVNALRYRAYHHAIGACGDVAETTASEWVRFDMAECAPPSSTASREGHSSIESRDFEPGGSCRDRGPSTLGGSAADDVSLVSEHSSISRTAIFSVVSSVTVAAICDVQANTPKAARADHVYENGEPGRDRKAPARPHFRFPTASG